jgi:hypothetical protein
MIVMIAVGIQKPWKGDLEAAVDTNLYHAFLGVCNIVFSFCMWPNSPNYFQPSPAHTDRFQPATSPSSASSPN